WPQLLLRMSGGRTGQVTPGGGARLDSAVRYLSYMKGWGLAVLALASGLAGCGDKPADRAGAAPSPPAPPAPAAAPEQGGDDGSPSLGPQLELIARLITHGRTDDARTQLQEYRRAHPEDGRAAFLLGLTYHREKRYGQARPLFEEAARLT